MATERLIYRGAAVAEERDDLPDHPRVTYDPVMPQPAGRHELGAGPGLHDRRAVTPAHLAIVPIVDHEQRDPHVGREGGDVEILPGKAEAPLEPTAHRRHDRLVDAEQRLELRAVGV